MSKVLGRITKGDRHGCEIPEKTFGHGKRFAQNNHSLFKQINKAVSGCELQSNLPFPFKSKPTTFISDEIMTSRCPAPFLFNCSIK